MGTSHWADGVLTWQREVSLEGGRSIPLWSRAPGP